MLEIEGDGGEDERGGRARSALALMTIDKKGKFRTTKAPNLGDRDKRKCLGVEQSFCKFGCTLAGVNELFPSGLRHLGSVWLRIRGRIRGMRLFSQTNDSRFEKK